MGKVTFGPKGSLSKQFSPVVQTVEKIVEVYKELPPQEQKIIVQYVEKEIPVVQEKIVEVVKYVEKEVPTIIETIKEVPVIIEKEIIKYVDRDVEKIKEIPTIVEKEITNFVDRIVVQIKLPKWAYLALGAQTAIIVTLLLLKLVK